MKLRWLFLVFLVFGVEVAFARDLGVFGETFEIEEKDLLDQIFSRLKVLQETGKLESENERVKSRIKETVLHPSAVLGITRCRVRREYKFDPSITVTRDLSDHRGRVFAKKGDRFNPLERMSLTKPLIFIDGDDESQVKWSIFKIKENPLGKIVLVKGSPLDLQKRLMDVDDIICGFSKDKRQQMPALQTIYFDQHGLLTTKLGIKHVPAIVFQESGEQVLTIIEESGYEHEL